MKAAGNDPRPEPVTVRLKIQDIPRTDDDLDRFADDDVAAGAKRERKSPGATSIALPAEPPVAKTRRAAWIVAALVLIGLIGGLEYLRVRGLVPQLSFGALARPPAASTGEVSIESQPAGAEISVDGTAKGVTPLVLSLPPGEHVLALSLAGVRRERTVSVRAGAVASHFVEFSQTEPAAASAPAGNGRLEVTSDRAGVPVRVDGVRLGVTPVTLSEVRAGERHVTIGDGPNAVDRVVKVTPGALASVFASVPAAPPAGAGWVAISVPFEMQIAEGQVVLGTTSAARTMLPAGRHNLEFSSATLNFKTAAAVTVQPGATATLTVEVPQSTLSVNATPWAEVSIDGRAYGATPIGNIALPIGAHDVVWRHPTLGERRQSVLIKAGAPTRIAIDLNTP